MSNNRASGLMHYRNLGSFRRQLQIPQKRLRTANKSFFRERIVTFVTRL